MMMTLQVPKGHPRKKIRKRGAENSSNPKPSKQQKGKDTVRDAEMPQLQKVSKLLQGAMKDKVSSIFIHNPLLGLPNETPATAEIVAGRETDPNIELFHQSTLQEMPLHKLLVHTLLLQKAANASLNILEGLRIRQKDLEEENKTLGKGAQ